MSYEEVVMGAPRLLVGKRVFLNFFFLIFTQLGTRARLMGFLFVVGRGPPARFPRPFQDKKRSTSEITRGGQQITETRKTRNAGGLKTEFVDLNELL